VNADRVALETAEQLDPAALFLKPEHMAKLIRLEGPGLSEELSAPAWETLKALFEAKGLPEMLADRAQPSFASILLALDLNGADRGSLDEEIGKFATRKQKPVIGLESAESQMALIGQFASVPSLEKSLLEYREKGVERARAELAAKSAKLEAAYRQGDQAALMALVTEAEGANAAFAQTALGDRNRAWIPGIVDLHRHEGNAFIAVGSAHLFGADGVLELLRQQGFRITRVSAE
jgi:uncharacterized protein